MTRTKRLKAVFAVFAAIAVGLVMLVGSSIPAFASTGTPQNPGKISITSPDNVGNDVENTYTIYKIFDATTDGSHTAYKRLSGKDTVPSGFTADENGYITASKTDELTAEQISAIADYVTSASLTAAGTVKITGPNTTVQSEDLEPGYYYITTTTGTAVIVNSNQTTTIKDKNVLSTVVKSSGTEYSEDAKKAIQAVGQNQSFTSQITKKHGAGHIVYHDTMTNMTFNSPSLTVKVNGSDVAITNYTVSNATNDAGFTVTFDDSYIKGLDDDTVITLNYTAKITSDALQTDPAQNKAWLTLDNTNKTTEQTVDVYNAKLTVTKVNGDSEALTGAKFKLKNNEGKYYTVTGEGTSKVVSFGEEASATEVAADGGASHNVATFEGLPAGEYTLIESTVPSGYTKAADKTITVSGSTYTEENLSQKETVENTAGGTLPSTGGIGTYVFYAVGAALIAGAVSMMIRRKKQNA